MVVINQILNIHILNLSSTINIDAVPLGTIQFSKQVFCKIPGVFYAVLHGKPNPANLS
jgi:hypothetical protein